MGFTDISSPGREKIRGQECTSKASEELSKDGYNETQQIVKA